MQTKYRHHGTTASIHQQNKVYLENLCLQHDSYTQNPCHKYQTTLKAFLPVLHGLLGKLSSKIFSFRAAKPVHSRYVPGRYDFAELFDRIQKQCRAGTRDVSGSGRWRFGDQLAETRHLILKQDDV